MESTRTKNLKKSLTGPSVPIETNYGGLGFLYFSALQENLDKIHQVDTITGITETNGSVRTRAMQLALELKHLGVLENDIILISSRCHADQTIVVLACLFIAAIVAPFDPELNHKECVKMLQKLKPKVCFCDLRPLKQIERIIHENNMPVKLVHFGVPQNEAVTFRALLNHKVTDFKPVFIKAPQKHVAFILPTQGVTDAPKLVCQSHHSIYIQTLIILQMLKSPEKTISFYPLSWVIQVVLTCLSFGMPIIRILTGVFSERTACKLIHDLKVDNAFLCTELAMQLVDHVALRDFNVSCLKRIFIDSLPATNTKMLHIVSRMPRVKIIQVYSTTESGIVTGCSPENYEELREKCGSIGRVVENCQVKIVDVDTRETLGAEKCGELLVQSEGMMLGYLKDMQLTKSVMENNFLKTGDMAKCDTGGWLFIEGRVSDLVTINGEKVSMRKLEEVIIQHPFVSAVAIIGDERDILACVVPKPEVKLGEEKLMIFLKEELPEMFWPTKILFFDYLPVTSMGKVKMSTLREEFLKFKIEHAESVAALGMLKSRISNESLD